MSSFVLQSSPKQRDNYIIYYYYCNRTGTFTSRGNGKRSLKQQGTSKLGGYCTAYIRVKEYECGKVEAEICDHHMHEKKLVHLPLSDSVRKMIAAKLQDGVSVSSILDFIRDNVEGQLGRRELITHQDICNIRHQYNIEGIKFDADDAKSVSLWVQYFNSYCVNDNPVLLYKSQGTEPDGDLKDLNKDDFIICVQTPFQADMLREFGSEAVCVDSTHGTNVYDFKLITVIVLDELGEGIPVAWMISNREDALALMPFFRKIKQKCGDISAKVFMSDDADNFYNAWKSTFTVANTKKLICAWHVDRSWRRSLQKHINTVSDQANVYHYLQVLLTEKNINAFHQTLQQFVSWLSEREELGSFCHYFHREYSKSVEQWAPCYRAKCSVNTNMALEAFHRVLKVCYMEKKQNRRIDFLLHVLLKISRDKIFERFIKMQKGKSSHRICEISKRHRSAEKMTPSEMILSVSNGTWTIKSASLQQKYYSVHKESEVEKCTCKLRCNSCNVCIHQYSCTCMDFLIHSTICKHIHLVVISSHRHGDSPSPDPTSQQQHHSPDPTSETLNQLQQHHSPFIQPDPTSHVQSPDQQHLSTSLPPDPTSQPSNQQHHSLIISLDPTPETLDQQHHSPFIQPDPTSQSPDQQHHTVAEQQTMEGTNFDIDAQTYAELICVDVSQDVDSRTDTDVQIEVHAPDMSSLDYLSSHVNNNSKSSCTIQDKAIETCKKTEIALRRTTSMDAVKSAEKHLKAALTILNATQSTETLNTRKRVASNAHSQKQIRFHSTKKKRKQRECVSKPSDEKLSSCRKELHQTEITVCGICLKQNDTQSDQTLQWIQCDKCNMWFHQSCSKVNMRTTADDFCCKYCTSAST